MRYLIILILTGTLMAGCSVTSYAPAGDANEMRYTMIKPTTVSVNLISYPGYGDTSAYFQLLQKHDHDLDKVQLKKEIKRNDKIGDALGVLAITGGAVGIFEIVFPPVNHYFYYYVGAITLIYEAVYIVKMLTRPSSRYEAPYETGKLVPDKRLPYLSDKPCPISEPYLHQEDLIVTCNGKKVNVQSNNAGKFVVNLASFIEMNKGGHSNQITLAITSEKLKMAQDFIIKMKNSDEERTTKHSVDNFNSFDNSTIYSSNEDKDEQLLAEKDITSQQKLAEIALWSIDKGNREDAIDDLDNQRLLREVMLNSSDFPVRKIAFNKLNKNSLAFISNMQEAADLEYAISIKSNRLTWDKIFLNTGYSKLELKKIIMAAALLDSPQPNKYNVVAVCHAYIRLGDETTIPELCDLLFRFGDVILAEDYMNCGQSQLKMAGNDWCRKHGFIVLPGSGSHRVRWGEGMRN
jgi:hypothetical protein